MRLLRALLTLFAVSAGMHPVDSKLQEHFPLKRIQRTIGAVDLPTGCLYEGRWFTDGSIVATKEACIRCVCSRGALACTRRACSRLPESPPKRCHVLHRKGSCCPELHCPDGIKLLEQSASARFENEDFEDSAIPATISNACVEGGTIYAAGSAMSSSTACEQCFCLGGGRRCVRPQCVTTPEGCSARPSSGACCPQRYYCERTSTRPPKERHQFDCLLDRKWILEGERVNHAEMTHNCSQCFCLRGVVQCQPLACAQPLMGCEPLLRPGDCCPHRYHCNHRQGPKTTYFRTSSNIYTRSPLEIERFTEDKLSTKPKISLATKTSFTDKHIPLTSTFQQLISTNKVKRKTNDFLTEVSQLNNSTTSKFTPKTVTSREEPKTTNTNITPNVSTTRIIPKTTAQVTSSVTTLEEIATDVIEKPTEQPEGTIRIMINGTINCTAELSSTAVPLYENFNDTERITMETQPRIPLIDTSDLGVTFSPNDIITDRSVSDFDENETFSINVTSSLRTNTSASTKKPTATVPVTKIMPTTFTEASNSSKKTKGDYDYDYTEPTLPPSLPNLKIIPFVAADAVVEDETPKADMTYPSLDRNDKFPVYYPNIDTKEQIYPTRRTAVYNPTQYPVFVSAKVPHYSVSHSDEMTSYSNSNDQQQQLSSFDGRLSETNRIMKATTGTFELETPAVNLFSPPQETEGGFVPKDPGLIDDYYAAFSSTSPSSILSLPHLTTSMQLDISKGECTSSDGRKVVEGASIMVACLECRCLWSELKCSPRVCPTLECSSTGIEDPCCQPLICSQENKTTSHATYFTDKKNITTVIVTSSTVAPKTNSPPKQTNKTNTATNGSSNNTLNEEVTNTINVKMTTTTSKSIRTTSQKQTKKPITYEEDDEEEFSFGSVLKLLLSEYETTTAASKTKPPPIMRPTRKPLPSLAPFVPLSPYTPPKTSVNRIDHLILGESSAIVTSTPVPKTEITTRTIPTTEVTTRATNKFIKDEPKEVHYSSNEVTKSSTISGVPGLLKLAGCNIYGRMYRVGRIITELSTPCQECWCTELGVQCKALKC